MTRQEIERMAKLEERNEELARENAELKQRLEKAVELPYTERCNEYAKIVYKNKMGDIESETYFHDIYYKTSFANEVNGREYAEQRLAELKGEKNDKI